MSSANDKWVVEINDEGWICGINKFLFLSKDTYFKKIVVSYFLQLQKDFYFKKYGAKIVDEHRKSAVKKFGSDFFDEKHNFGAPTPPKGPRTAQLPTFWEFVQYLKNTK